MGGNSGAGMLGVVAVYYDSEQAKHRIKLLEHIIIVVILNSEFYDLV